MIKPLLFSKTVYLPIHSIQVFENIRTPNKVEKGIKAYVANYSGIAKAFSLCTSFYSMNATTFFIDFSHIRSIGPNLRSFFNDFIDATYPDGKCIILANINYDLLTSFSDIIRFLEAKFHGNHIDINNQRFIVFTSAQIDIESLIHDQQLLIEQGIENHIVNCVKECTHDYNKVAPSTPVILEKYINVKELIELKDNMQFLLYRLALNIPSLDFALFCHTLNGAYIGGVLAELLQIDLVSVDHIGPINQVYHSVYDKLIIPGKKYIVASDVICIGTELKIAKSIIEFAGGTFAGSVSIVEVSMDGTEKPLDSHYPLVTISVTKNPLGYFISTLYNKA